MTDADANTTHALERDGPLTERMKFVAARLKRDESFTAICDELGISRQKGTSGSAATRTMALTVFATDRDGRIPTRERSRPK